MLAPGTRERIEIPIARLPATQAWVNLPIVVVHGARPGARLWLSGAIHGDELSGIEIVRRVLHGVDPARLRGTLIAVPVVNVFGLQSGSRYLPDRRDLNRSFPGAKRGSLAARLAHIFMTEVVAHATHGIDLHTGSDHRTNLPQIRAELRGKETLRLAQAFGAPVIVEASTRDGSLRAAATRLGVPALLYEGGEPLRFDREAIRVGVRGVQRVMRELGMLGGSIARSASPPLHVTHSRWLRARSSGLLRLEVELGARVARGQVIGEISDAFEEVSATVAAPSDGVVIGMTLNPLVRQGDAVAHLADRFHE